MGVSIIFRRNTSAVFLIELILIEAAVINLILKLTPQVLRSEARRDKLILTATVAIGDFILHVRILELYDTPVRIVRKVVVGEITVNY